jgi:hypothetical protein
VNSEARAVDEGLRIVAPAERVLGLGLGNPAMIHRPTAGSATSLPLVRRGLPNPRNFVVARSPIGRRPVGSIVAISGTAYAPACGHDRAGGERRWRQAGICAIALSLDGTAERPHLGRATFRRRRAAEEASGAGESRPNWRTITLGAPCRLPKIEAAARHSSRARTCGQVQQQGLPTAGVI